MRTLAAAVIAGGLLLSGCGGNPAPAPLPTGSASPTPSPSAAAPVLPEAAKTKDEAGALAFGRYYVELINYAQANGDVTALQKVEDPGCESCGQAAKFITDLYADGGSIKGGDFTVESSTATKNPATKGWLISMGVSFTPQVIDYPSPTADKSPGGGRAPLNVQVVSSEGEWRVLEWTRGA